MAPPEFCAELLWKDVFSMRRSGMEPLMYMAPPFCSARFDLKVELVMWTYLCHPTPRSSHRADEEGYAQRCSLDTRIILDDQLYSVSSHLPMAVVDGQLIRVTVKVDGSTVDESVVLKADVRR